MQIKKLSDCVQILWPDRWLNVYPGDPIPNGLSKKALQEVEAWLDQCRIELQAQAMDADAENEAFNAEVAKIVSAEETEKKRLLREILIEEGVIPGK